LNSRGGRRGMLTPHLIIFLEVFAAQPLEVLRERDSNALRAGLPVSMAGAAIQHSRMPRHSTAVICRVVSGVANGR